MEFKHFDNMAWPVPPDGLSGKLRHEIDIDQTDKLNAAAIIDAYKELVNCTEKKRKQVIKQLKSHTQQINSDGKECPYCHGYNQHRPECAKD